MRRLLTTLVVMLFMLGTLSTALAMEGYLAPAAGQVTIDGDVIDWLGVPGQRMEDPLGLVGPADFYVQWDSQYLYLLVIAEDEVHYNVANGVTIWQGDNLQLSLDGNNDKANHYNDGDYEYGWALTESGPDQYRWYGAKGVDYDPTSILFVVKRIAANRDGKAATIYEIALPAAQVAPMKLEKGTVIGFNLLINDDDGAGRNWFEWTLGTGRTKDPSHYNSLTLD